MDEIKDVDFNEVEKVITGQVLYYNTSQVAQILGIPDSTVRYYTKALDSVLKIELINKQRKYTQEDIDKLRYICELKSEGLSIRQIEQYCTNVDLEGGIVKESSPLTIQALAVALAEQQRVEMQKFEEKLIERLGDVFKIKQDQIELIANQMRDEVVEAVDEKLEEIKIAYVDMEKEKNRKKSFIDRLLNR